MGFDCFDFHLFVVFRRSLIIAQNFSFDKVNLLVYNQAMIFAIIPVLIIAGSVMLFSVGDIGKSFDLKYPDLKLKLNLSVSGSAGSPLSPLPSKAASPPSPPSPPWPRLLVVAFYDPKPARKYSLFIRAMCATEMPLGHLASQA